jgi:GTP cyclohydrolase III
VTPQIPIATYATRTEAEIVRGLLETSGIRAWLSGDDAGGAYPIEMSGGVRVMVEAVDRDAAADILAGAGDAGEA